MKLIHTVREVTEEVRNAHREGRVVGVVPTMGALHEGHRALIDMARDECGFVVVSVFVNPAQFAPTEDFAKYPRTLDADAEMCREADVDIVFAPSAEEMYPEGFNAWVEVDGLTKVLEGEFRPTHFRGVTTVCNKLFNITRADCVYFGMKDYQQLKVIEKMVNDLNMPVCVVPVQIVREADGLAKSSRNRYLSPQERKAALVLSKSLSKARDAYKSGERNVVKLRSMIEEHIKSEPLAVIDYVAVVDAETLQPIETINHPGVALLAVRIGATRLIDNIVFK